jgi:hypothetical protein
MRITASEEIPRFFWKPEVHYRVHNSPPPVPILSQINLVHTLTFVPKIHFNIILSSASVFLERSLCS